MVALREKNIGLETKLRELIEYAKENDALQHKVHDFIVALFAARDLPTLQEMIPHLLKDIFAVPHAALRLWQVNPPSVEVLAFADTQTKPVCLHQAAHETADWFGESGKQLHFLRLLSLHAAATPSACWCWPAKRSNASTPRWASCSCSVSPRR